jgi:hypothetical protein
LPVGRSLTKTTAALSLSRNTVHSYARAVSPEELLVNDATGKRAGILGGGRFADLSQLNVILLTGAGAP